MKGFSVRTLWMAFFFVETIFYNNAFQSESGGKLHEKYE